MKLETAVAISGRGFRPLSHRVWVCCGFFQSMATTAEKKSGTRCCKTTTKNEKN
jgi:hypothetical protein